MSPFFFYCSLSAREHSTINMGIKKAQTPSHISSQACDSPKSTMVEVCAMERSFNVDLVLLIKSRSRSQFDWIIEQQKVRDSHESRHKDTNFKRIKTRKTQFFAIFTLFIIYSSSFFNPNVASLNKL